VQRPDARKGEYPRACETIGAGGDCHPPSIGLRRGALE
jgi:hypothetical protein